MAKSLVLVVDLSLSLPSVLLVGRYVTLRIRLMDAPPCCAEMVLHFSVLLLADGG